jgi:hypothetical protein
MTLSSSSLALSHKLERSGSKVFAVCLVTLPFLDTIRLWRSAFASSTAADLKTFFVSCTCACLVGAAVGLDESTDGGKIDLVLSVYSPILYPERIRTTGCTMLAVKDLGVANLPWVLYCISGVEAVERVWRHQQMKARQHLARD